MLSVCFSTPPPPSCPQPPPSIAVEHLWHQKLWTLQITTCVSCFGPLHKVCSKTHWIINSSLCSTHPSPASSVQHVWWQPSGCVRNTLHVRPPSFPLISTLSAHGCRFVSVCWLKDACFFFIPSLPSLIGCYSVLRRWSRWEDFLMWTSYSWNLLKLHTVGSGYLWLMNCRAGTISQLVDWQKIKWQLF